MVEPEFLSSTRASYDAVAADYADRFADELADRPLERSLLAAFAELVGAAGSGRPIADVGCGPGHVTAHLNGLGVPAFGLDLSAGMIAVARRAYPGLQFEQGTMTALDVPDGELGGIVALYSIIHIPDDQLPGVFAEFRRVLAPGGCLLLAFQVGDERRYLTEWFGRTVSLHGIRRPPERVAELLTGAGFAMYATLLREPYDDTEQGRRAYLLARVPAETA